MVWIFWSLFCQDVKWQLERCRRWSLHYECVKTHECEVSKSSPSFTFFNKLGHCVWGARGRLQGQLWGCTWSWHGSGHLVTIIITWPCGHCFCGFLLFFTVYKVLITWCQAVKSREAQYLATWAINPTQSESCLYRSGLELQYVHKVCSEPLGSSSYPHPPTVIFSVVGW